MREAQRDITAEQRPGLKEQTVIKGRLRANVFVQLLYVNDEQEDGDDSGDTETETERRNEWTCRTKQKD